jgi:RNA polymerase sigma factor (sigma-70 family)
MSHVDTHPPPADIELVATSGVKLIVRNDPPPTWLAEAQEEPEPEPEIEPTPRVVIRPPQEPGRPREVFFRKLDADYGGFLLLILLARRDVPPASAEDLRQRALEILFKEADVHGLPRDVKCYLGGIVRNLVRNRRRKWSPDIDPATSGSGVPCAAPDPEVDAEQTERWSRLVRHMTSLSDEEAEAFQCIEILGMSPEEAAKDLGRPLSTVHIQAKRAVAKIKDLVLESDEAVERGDRRRSRD